MVNERPKFIVGPVLTDRKYWVLLSDYMYWGKGSTLDELDDWCEKHLANGKNSIEGSVIQFSNDKELAFFILRWS